MEAELNQLDKGVQRKSSLAEGDRHANHQEQGLVNSNFAQKLRLHKYHSSIDL